MTDLAKTKTKKKIGGKDCIVFVSACKCMLQQHVRCTDLHPLAVFQTFETNNSAITVSVGCLYADAFSHTSLNKHAINCE